MRKADRIILELLRKALRPEYKVEETLFEGVPWAEVIEVASAQGVLGVCFDAVELLPDTCRPDIDNLMEWLGQTSYLEEQNRQQMADAVRLAALWRENGIHTLVMKGASVGRLYVKPLHRYSCDMDCILVTEGVNDCNTDGWIAAKKGDKVVKATGVDVNTDYYRNSSFDFGSLHVENHRFCTYVKGSSRGKRYERLLRKLLCQPTAFIEGQLEAPCDMFVALHTLSHAQGHFLSEGITLKHLCDWAVILKAFHGSLDWGLYQAYCKEYGMDKFLYAMSRLAHRYLGAELPFVCDDNDVADIRLLEDMLTFQDHMVEGQGNIKRRIEYAKQKLRSSWKYRYFSDKSMLTALAQQTYGYLFEKDIRL